jgi:hypothetical protein
MKQTWIFLTALVVAACTAQSQPTATPVPPLPAESQSAWPLPAVRGELFATAGVCAACHSRLADAAGDISVDTLWRATMMANAARDPYWQASMRAEVLRHPDYQAAIEDKCTTCHTPMARFTAFVNGETGQALDSGFFDPAHPLHALALDGVSCTVCHQIGEANLGQSDSFSGHYDIDRETPAGRRSSYGPFPVDHSQVTVMQGSAGFVPHQSYHVQRSHLCATCHTLYTIYFDANGQIGGEFPEQTPYLEWFHSDYRREKSCIACHMPAAEGTVYISNTGGVPRQGVRKHELVGGNAYVLGLLQQFGGELDISAAPEHFDAAMARLTDQMQNRTAALKLGETRLSAGTLNFAVEVQNLAGHKFPTAYPSRRAWLHVTVRDAGGRVVFESGAVKPDGSIAGNDNDADPSAFEPHYSTINSPDQVQIYEAIMHTVEGDVTTTLLRGAGYLKDNRLLPHGFESVDDIAVRGQAAEDGDFAAGGDSVQYRIAVNDAAGPFTVDVELLYQSISFRWADNLRQLDAAEIQRFLSFQEAAPLQAVLVASATGEVE